MWTAPPQQGHLQEHQPELPLVHQLMLLQELLLEHQLELPPEPQLGCPLPLVQHIILLLDPVRNQVPSPLHVLLLSLPQHQLRILLLVLRQSLLRNPPPVLALNLVVGQRRTIMSHPTHIIQLLLHREVRLLAVSSVHLLQLASLWADTCTWKTDPRKLPVCSRTNPTTDLMTTTSNHVFAKWFNCRYGCELWLCLEGSWAVDD
jgi:hypothetical protein